MFCSYSEITNCFLTLYLFGTACGHCATIKQITQYTEIFSAVEISPHTTCLVETKINKIKKYNHPKLFVECIRNACPLLFAYVPNIVVLSFVTRRRQYKQ